MRRPAIYFGAVILAGGLPLLAAAGGWSAMPRATSRDLSSVWGSSADDLVAVGESGTIVRWDGADWLVDDSGTTRWLHGVWGDGAGDYFAVGENGLILRSSGSTWTTGPDLTGRTLRGVWGAAADDVFVVGDNGTILRLDGETWSLMGSGTAANLNAVWGAAGGQVFAVGDGGEIRVWNGVSWQAGAADTESDLRAVWGSEAGDAYAAGDGGALLHWDGSDWTVDDSGVTRPLSGVGGTPDETVAAGDRGTIISRASGGWMIDDSGTVRALTAVWGAPSGDIFVVGGSGTALRSRPLGVRLELPTTYVHPGETFFVTGYVDNPGSPLPGVPVFFLLEVFGEYWFWPGWRHFIPPDTGSIDLEFHDLPTGTLELTVIEPFIWPDTGADTVTGLRFWGACLNASQTDLLGGYAMIEWGYGPP